MPQQTPNKAKRKRRPTNKQKQELKKLRKRNHHEAKQKEGRTRKQTIHRNQNQNRASQNIGSLPSLVQCVKNRSSFEWLICPVQFGCSIIHGMSCSSKSSQHNPRNAHNLRREAQCVCTVTVHRYCTYQLIASNRIRITKTSKSSFGFVQCVKNRSNFEWPICPVRLGCSTIHGSNCSFTFLVNSNPSLFTIHRCDSEEKGKCFSRFRNKATKRTSYIAFLTETQSEHFICIDI